MLTYRFTMEAGSTDGVCDVTRWHRVSLERRGLKTDRSQWEELQHTASPHHHWPELFSPTEAFTQP